MKLAVVLACFVVFCLAEKPLPCTSPPLLTGGFSVTTQNEKVEIYGKYLYDAVGQRVRLFDIGSIENQTFTADVLLHYTEVSHSQTPFFCLHEISTASCDSKNLPQQFISIALQLTSTPAGSEQPVQLCSWWASGEHSSTVHGVHTGQARRGFFFFFFFCCLLARLSPMAAMYEIDDAKRTCKKSPLKADFQPLKIPQDATRIPRMSQSSLPGQGVLMNNWSGKLPDKSGDFRSTVTELGCFPVSSLYQTKEFGWVLANYYNNVIGITDPDLLEPPEFCAGAVMDVEAEPRNYLSVYAKEN